MNVTHDPRTEVSETVLTVWAVNSCLNSALLDHLTPEMLNARVSGGWDVARHLAHMTEAKTYWTGLLDAGAMRALPALLDDPDAPSFGAERDLRRIREVMALTEQAVLETVDRADSLGGLPYATLDVFLLHLTHHDAHHRALILLALRHGGHQVPGDHTMWAPWRDGDRM